jgi:hypothetical protein
MSNTISEFKPIIRNWTGMSSLSPIGGTFLSRLHILYVRFQLGNGISYSIENPYSKEVNQMVPRITCTLCFVLLISSIGFCSVRRRSARAR